MSTLSIIQPVAKAIQRSRGILFEPFLFRKWLRLGFCAFLIGPLLMNPTFSGGVQNSSPDSSSDNGGSGLEGVIPWVQDHVPLIIMVTAVALLLMVGLGLLLTWLSSRGHFMLLDGVVRNRGAIMQPWHEFRQEANSLFRFRFCFGVICLISLLMILAVPAAGIGMAVQSSSAPPLWIISMVLLGGVFTLAMLLAWFVVVIGVPILLADFVVPVMYLHRIPVLKAWRLVRDSLLRQHRGSAALYLLARFLLNSAVSTLATLASLLTCCIGFLPYVGSVILLPLIVFQISYPLAFLEQLGPEWTFFPSDRSSPSS
jgi:hypothetical protein